jgi:glucose-fructose oxidoreductase
VRYAVVGQGQISQIAILPAFARARRNSELAGLVSDDLAKLQKLGHKYKVERLYTYDRFGDCLSSGEIDAVFIALPNHLHHLFAQWAARAGIHVVCEKPLAVTEEECEEMVEQAERHRVKLMTAYRLHFERANLKAGEIVRSGRLGRPRIFNSLFSMQVVEGNVRLQSELGGGPLYDLGIDCINAARYLFRAEPLEVFAMSANSGEARFREVDEMTSAVLRYPKNRLATFTFSFGATDESVYELVGTEGRLRVENAYGVSGPIEHRLTIGDRTRHEVFPSRDPLAAQLLYFSDCVLTGRDPEPSGREGWADVRVIRALLRSAEIGRPVHLDPFEKQRRPDLAQGIRGPLVVERDLAGARFARGPD